MTWIAVIPNNSGGGRTPGPPGAKFYANGQLAFSASAYANLGEPQRCLVERSDSALRIRPTTASDQGGFSVVGGGGQQHRITLKLVAHRHPALTGELQGAIEDGALILWRKDQDRPVVARWHAVRPEAHSAQGTQARADAYLYADGRVRLSARVARELGYAGVKVLSNADLGQLRLTPATADDPQAFRLHGSPGTEVRFSMTTFIKANPTLVGEYSVKKFAGGMVLIKK
jgi:hypothetical protein